MRRKSEFRGENIGLDVRIKNVQKDGLILDPVGNCRQEGATSIGFAQARANLPSAHAGAVTCVGSDPLFSRGEQKRIELLHVNVAQEPAARRSR